MSSKKDKSNYDERTATDERSSFTLDLSKLNEEIDRFYAVIGIRRKVDNKVQLASEGKGSLLNVQLEVRRKQEMLEFIQRMDENWSKNGIDPDGFQFCVPSVGHVEYWSEPRWQWNFGTPRYTKADVEDVKRYYLFKRELGLPADEPSRHDIGRFVNGAIKAVNDKVLEVGKDVSSKFRQVVNDLHAAVSDGILIGINVDTTDLKALNQAFNQGMSALDNEARKWHGLSEKLLASKLIEINEITVTRESAADSQEVTAIVKFSVLGQPHSHTMVLNMNDPAGSIRANLSDFLPNEIKSLVA